MLRFREEILKSVQKTSKKYNYSTARKHKIFLEYQQFFVYFESFQIQFIQDKYQKPEELERILDFLSGKFNTKDSFCLLYTPAFGDWVGLFHQKDKKEDSKNEDETDEDDLFKSIFPQKPISF
jgi:hypothetical protein